MIFPKEFQDLINNTMDDPNFPFQNMTHFVMIGSLVFQQGFMDSCKKNSDRDEFVNEIIKVARHMKRIGMIPENLYGWKEGFREKV